MEVYRLADTVKMNDSQTEYLNLIAELMSIRKRGEVPLAYIRTYGCQQNVADSERIKGMLRVAGYSFTENAEDADFILFNTCAVREHAEQRVLGNVGALNHTKKARPGQVIALCGCMVQQEHMTEKIRRSYPIVDLVFGPHELWRFPELLEQVMEKHRRVFATEQQNGVDFAEDRKSTRLNSSH